MNNLRQVMLAFRMYGNDNEGWIPINRSGKAAADDPKPKSPNWVAGVVSYGDIGAANSALLVDRTYSQFAGYIENPRVYRCPADRSTAQADHLGEPRARSYAMSGAIGCRDLDGSPRVAPVLQEYPPPGGGRWNIYTKTSQMKGPLAPSEIWVVVDEHPDFINDPEFALRMAGQISEAIWSDVPAKYHGDSCVFAFADGHAKIHRWRHPEMIPPILYKKQPLLKTPDPDVLWFYLHTTIPVR